jgi:endogenous inhibitor of DNA gyrase (YacG/DUF329 family)
MTCDYHKTKTGYLSECGYHAAMLYAECPSCGLPVREVVRVDCAECGQGCVDRECFETKKVA